MDQQITPAHGLSLFATMLKQQVTGEVGFIVPTLIEPVSVSVQLTDNPKNFFSVQRIQVKQFQTKLVYVPPPPNEVKPLGGDGGSGGGKLEPESGWVVIREVEGLGTISAAAGEAVVVEVAFTLGETDDASVQDFYAATLDLIARPLTFAPYSLVVATGNILTSQLLTDQADLLQDYGGTVEIGAQLLFGASTAAVYELVGVDPTPAGPMYVTVGPVVQPLYKTQTPEISVPITVGADVAVGTYNLTLRETAYEGQQTQEVPATVNVAHPNDTGV